jgi:hypothetical protein
MKAAASGKTGRSMSACPVHNYVRVLRLPVPAEAIR